MQKTLEADTDFPLPAMPRGALGKRDVARWRMNPRGANEENALLNQYTTKDRTFAPFNRSRPLRNLSSIRKEISRISAFNFFTSDAAAAAVPPVARRSSINNTRAPGFSASICIAMDDVPYSKSYSCSWVLYGNLPF